MQPTAIDELINEHLINTIEHLITLTNVLFLFDDIRIYLL